MYYPVNPEVPFDDFNTGLTGLSAETNRDALTFPQVWDALKPRFDHAVAVAHNASFDLTVLEKTFRAYGIQQPPMPYLCTMQLSKRVLPQLPHHRLNDLCDFYGIDLNHHRADSDSTACAQVLLQLMEEGGRTPLRKKVFF